MRSSPGPLRVGRRRATTIVSLAVLLAACGGNTTVAGLVPVSPACDAAMFAYATATTTAAGAVAPRLVVAIDDACRSKKEWLSAVVPYTTADATGCVACFNAAPAAVYASMCRTTPTAPACRNAG